MKNTKLLSIAMVFVMICTILVGVYQPVYAANGNYTGAAGFTVNAYPDGVRINMTPVASATDYKVYMSTDGTLTTDLSSASCLYSSGSYQPYAYFTNGDMDKLNTTTPVTINPATTYFFYYVTNGTTITTKYEAQTQAAGKSWTSTGNYDTSWYTAGSSPYTISSAAQLAGLAYLVNSGTDFTGKTVNLGASVDVSAYPWTAIGNLAIFSGTFNGQNNVVDGIYLNSASQGVGEQGLFGKTCIGSIKNLGVVNGFVKSSGSKVGGVVGDANSSLIQDCYNTGIVTGWKSVGGVVGSTGNSVQNCYNTGRITSSSSDVGGVVGSTGNPVQNCYNTGSVTATGASSFSVGGVAGGGAVSVNNCYNTGSVTAAGAGSYYIGGVAGEAGSIQNSYNTGSVTSLGTYVGGTVGMVTTVQDCYNMGNVTGSSPVGGVAGDGTIKNSYADCNVNSAASEIYYDSNGANGTFADAATCLTDIDDSTNFCAAPTQYAAGGVFSGTNEVNNGYPVLKAFGYTGNDTSIDSEFSVSGSTYPISNAYQLDLVRNYLATADNTKIFQLAGNIDISPAQYNQQITGGADGADSWKPIGTSSSPFTATFDGVNYSISGLYINSANMFQGLFGCASQIGGSGGGIKNVGISGMLVSSSGYVGSIVGDTDYNFIVQNCYNTGSVTASGNRVGGVVGSVDDVTSVQNCYNAGNVTGTGSYVGGVVGSTIGSVQNCYNIGSVSGTGALSFGGVVGFANFGATVQNCYNTGSVSDSRNSSGSVGSIVGEGLSGSSVQNCYNTGSVTDTGNNSQGIGGLVGYTAGSVQNCYNTGIVSDTGSGSKYVGGVVGMGGAASTILNCYYCGYNGGVGNSSDNTATDTPGQTTPFTKLAASSIAAGSQTSVIEDTANALVGASELGDAFAVSFGPYSSSNPSAATVSGTTVNGVAVGNANITGTITITQNNLNMAPVSTGWLSTTQTITAQVLMPLTVSPSYAATVNLNKDGSLWTGSGKTITLQQASETPTTTTDTSGVFTANVANGTWKILLDGADTGATVVINNAAASQDLNYYTVQFGVTDAGTASGSTISAAYNSSPITSGDVVLGGQQLVITAAGAGASSYTYAWSGAGTSSETTAALTISALSSLVNATCNVTGTGTGTGTGTPLSYTVSIGTLPGGSITANPTSATSGTDINLTITPYSGMRLKSGTLKYNDGSDHTITETSFTMPAANVTVSAEFEAIPPASTLTTLTLSGTIPNLTVAQAVYDLNNLSLSGTDQYGDPFSLSGQTIQWNLDSGNSYASLTGSTLTPLAVGTGTVTATVYGVTSNDLGFTVFAPSYSGGGGGNGGGGGGSSSPSSPSTSPNTVTGNVIDGATGTDVSHITGTVTIDGGNDTVSLTTAQLAVLGQPDGTTSSLGDLTQLSITGSTGNPVQISADGTVQVADLARGTDNNYNITYDLGNGQKITISTLEIKINSSGTATLTETLIDPYGTITDAATGKALAGVNVTLYYADTVRNKAAGKTPDTVVALPGIPGFNPNNNKDPQTSDVSGAYGFMVFQDTDYYIVASKDGYNKYTSPTISVGQDELHWDFSMTPTTSGVTRLAGENRVDTALAIAQAEYPGKIENVVLATADNYPDALTGSALAYKVNAPILLVGSLASDQEKVLAYLKSNLDPAGTVYILGGNGAVSGTVENEIAAGGLTHITRLGGTDRYETSAKIADQLGVTTGTPVVLVSGENYPDALSISSVAAQMQLPILLVQQDGLSGSVSQEIAAIKPSKIYIIGGEGVISPTVESQAAQLTGLTQSDIVRIGGADRYATSLAVAQYFNLGGQICVATGSNFPDALTGSVYAARHNSSIILADGSLPDQVVSYLKSKNLSGAILFDGEAAVSQGIEQQLGQLTGSQG